MIVPIDQIKVGDRRREDMGDIAGLMKSIKRYGLIHPIVIDADANLIAGGRRLEAFRRLGEIAIEATDFGELTEAERREIELEENLQRKDLTAYERSKTIVERSEVAAQALAEKKVLPESGKSPNGRPPTGPAALAEVARYTNTPRSTIQEAQAHVATAEAFPFMQAPDWKQYQVLEAREKLERLPEPERVRAAALIDKPATPPKTAITMLANLAEMAPDKRARVFDLDASDDPRDKSLALTEAAALPAMPDPRVVLVGEAAALLSKAAKQFPDDPMAEEIRDEAARLKALRDRLRNHHAERNGK